MAILAYPVGFTYQTRQIHHKDVLLSQNKHQNLNLTQEFGLGKPLTGFFLSWSFHISHICHICKWHTLWVISIKTRPKHDQDVILGQNKPLNLNLTQKIGLEKSLSGFSPSWSLRIYHIYIYISKK